MTRIKLFTILLSFSLASPLAAMLRRDDTPILQKRLEKDVLTVEQAEDPSSVAKAILDEASRWNYGTTNYVCEAAKKQYTKAFDAFLDAGASYRGSMDASLCANFRHGIDELFKRDKPYDCKPESLGKCNAETLEFFVAKVSEYRKDNQQELEDLSDAVILNCDPAIGRQFVKRPFGVYFYYYAPINQNNSKAIAVADAYLRIYALGAQGLAVKPYEDSKRLVLFNALNRLDAADNAKPWDADQYNVPDIMRTIDDTITKHPITFSSEKSDIELANKAYAAAIKYDDYALLNKLEAQKAPLPKAQMLGAYMAGNPALIGEKPISESSYQIVQWCLQHDAQFDILDLNFTLETVLLSLSKEKSDPEACKKLYALLKSKGARLRDIFLRSHESSKEETITFLLVEDLEALQQPTVALSICKKAELQNNKDLLNRFYPYTPAGHYTARKYLAAFKSMFSATPSNPGYQALSTSESAAQSSELMVVTNNGENKKDK